MNTNETTAVVAEAPVAKPAKPARVKKVTDIRETLPVAVKGGTASKPIWTIGEDCFEYTAPLKKNGLDKEGHKPRLGSRTLIAKYEASKTAKGAPLMFVGVFRKVDGVKAAAAAPAVEGEVAPVEAAPEVPVVTGAGEGEVQAIEGSAE